MDFQKNKLIFIQRTLQTDVNIDQRLKKGSEIFCSLTFSLWPSDINAPLHGFAKGLQCLQMFTFGRTHNNGERHTPALVAFYFANVSAKQLLRSAELFGSGPRSPFSTLNIYTSATGPGRTCVHPAREGSFSVNNDDRGKTSQHGQR